MNFLWRVFFCGSLGEMRDEQSRFFIPEPEKIQQALRVQPFLEPQVPTDGSTMRYTLVLDIVRRSAF